MELLPLIIFSLIAYVMGATIEYYRSKNKYKKSESKNNQNWILAIREWNERPMKSANISKVESQIEQIKKRLDQESNKL